MWRKGAAWRWHWQLDEERERRSEFRAGEPLPAGRRGSTPAPSATEPGLFWADNRQNFTVRTLHR